MMLFRYVCSCCCFCCLVEKSEAHVIVRDIRLLLLLLLFLLGLSSGRVRCSGGSSTTSWGSANTGSNVGDQVLNVDTLQGLGEKAGPVGLHINIGGLQDGRDFLTLKAISNKKYN